MFLGIYPLFSWLIIAGLSDHSYSDKGSEARKGRVCRQDHRKLRTFTSLIYPLASPLWVLGALNGVGRISSLFGTAANYHFVK